MPAKGKKWARFAVMLLSGFIAMSCGKRPPQVADAPPPSPSSLPSPLDGIGRGPAIPLPEGLPTPPAASPSPFARIPFAFPPGPNARVCVYDRSLQDVYAYPGTGPGVQSVFELAHGQYYYDDTRNIYLLDAWREEQIKLVDGVEVGGFAFAVSFDANNRLYFLGQSDPKLAEKLIGLAYMISEAPSTASVSVATWSLLPSHPPAEIGPYLGKPRFLSVINAFAIRHGQLTSITVNTPSDLLLFTTGDGGLYFYSVPDHRVFPVFADDVIAGGFFATAPSIDPVWGRYVVWQDTKRKGLLVFDRWLGTLDTVPYANLAQGNIQASAPSFHGSDPYEVVFTITLPGGDTKLVGYNILTEQVLNLAVLNAFTNPSNVRSRLEPNQVIQPLPLVISTKRLLARSLNLDPGGERHAIDSDLGPSERLGPLPGVRSFSLWKAPAPGTARGLPIAHCVAKPNDGPDSRGRLVEP